MKKNVVVEEEELVLVVSLEAQTARIIKLMFEE